MQSSFLSLATAKDTKIITPCICAPLPSIAIIHRQVMNSAAIYVIHAAEMWTQIAREHLLARTISSAAIFADGYHNELLLLACPPEEG